MRRLRIDPEMSRRLECADAVHDGVLIDVTEAAKEAGFKRPVALTRGAYVRSPRGPPAAVRRSHIHRRRAARTTTEPERYDDCELLHRMRQDFEADPSLARRV